MRKRRWNITIPALDTVIIDNYMKHMEQKGVPIDELRAVNDLMKFGIKKMEQVIKDWEKPRPTKEEIADRKKENSLYL